MKKKKDSIAARIKRYRKRLGLTQLQMGRKLRMTQGSISKLENGEFLHMNVAMLQKIARLGNDARADFQWIVGHPRD